MINFRKILVPVDFSDNAALAVSWGISMLRDQKEAEMVLMHVPLPVPVMEGPFDLPDVMEPLRKNAAERLESWRTRVPGEIQTRIFVGLGNPADDIVAYATRERIDLIVMTTAGRHGLSRLVHPSLTETVVRNAPCPVMALHLNNATRTQAVTE